MIHAYHAGDFHRLLAKTYRAHEKRAFNNLGKIEISTGQPRILHYLSTHDGCIQKDISSNFDLEPATITDILSIMEKNGLVTRKNDPGDRRVLRVYLTEKGIDTHEKVESIYLNIEKDCFEGFSDSEKEHAFMFLDRIYNNLKRKETTETQ
jgi:DNA-binding MarR family transcriptional regulator